MAIIRVVVPMQMLLRKSLVALSLALCSFSAIGCSDISYKVEGPSVTYTPSAAALEENAIKKVKAGDFEGAINDLDQLIEMLPEYAPSYYRRGTVKAELGLLEEGIEDVRKSISLDSDDHIAYLNYSVLLLRSSDGSREILGEALKSANKSIELNSKESSAYYNRGLIKYQLKDFNGAMSDYSKTIELDENDSQALRQRGLLFSELGIVNSACADLERASSLGDAKSLFFLRMNSETCDYTPEV